jgi:hypothetical protein
MDWYVQLVIGCILFLLLFGVGRMFAGKKGTWSQTLPPTYDPIVTRDGTDSDSAGEQRVRLFLERYFKLPFNKVRPDFLENTVTGHNLELDCYNDDLKLAVEYNGRQHYEFTPRFQANKEAFYNQRYRDELKKIWCREHGITLLTVPYTEKDIEYFLAKKLAELQGDEEVERHVLHGRKKSASNK